MRTSAMARLAVMGVLLIALMIPLTMTHSVVSERAARRDAAAAEVGSIWGGAQIVGGPVLTVPYRTSYVDNQGQVRQTTRHVFLLPEALDFKGTVHPSRRLPHRPTRAPSPFRSPSTPAAAAIPMVTR